jgi:hypothetical protein
LLPLIFFRLHWFNRLEFFNCRKQELFKSFPKSQPSTLLPSMAMHRLKLFRIYLWVVLGIIFNPLDSAALSLAVNYCVAADSLRIDTLVFQGLNSTSRSVVERELSNQVNAPFSCSKWEIEKNRLMDLDIFADVEIQAMPKDSSVTLRYIFRELPPYIPFIAVSKTEQDGLSLGPALTSFNFLGQGIRAEFISRFGGTSEAQISLSSTRIADWPLEYDLALLRIDSYNNFEKFHEDSWRGKVDLVHHLNGAIHLLYAGEIFYLQTQGLAKSQVLLTPQGDLVPRLGGGLIWDTRDRHHDPRHGVYQELRVTQNGGWLGGPADYSEWLSDTRTYLPWLNRNTFHFASLYQYRTGVQNETFGRYDQFHVGGINTLRGFSHDAYRGKSEIVFTFENRLDLFRKRPISLWRWSTYMGLQGILGLESASLWDHEAIMERDLHTGMYLGLHLLLAGIDRVRLECGSNFAKFQLEADLGILDKPDIQRFRAR